MSNHFTVLMGMQWRQMRFPVLGAVALMLLLTAFLTVQPIQDLFGGNVSAALAGLCVALTLIGFTLGLPIALYDEKDLRPLLPTHLQTLPVRNSVLTASIFCFRLLILIPVSLGAIGLFWLISGGEALTGGDIYEAFLLVPLAAVAVYTILQTASLVFGGLGAIFAYSVGLGLCALAAGTFMWDLEKGIFHGNIIAALGVAAVFPILGLTASWWGMGLYRRGALEAFSGRWGYRFASRDRSDPPFSSPLQAQTWLETRRMAMFLPGMTCLFLVLIMPVQLYFFSNFKGSATTLILLLWFMPVAAAGCTAVVLGIRNYRGRHSGDDAFFTTLPIKTRELATARLWGGFASFGNTLLIMLLVTAVLAPLVLNLGEFQFDARTFIAHVLFWSLCTTWTFLWGNTAGVLLSTSVPIAALTLVSALTLFIGVDIYAPLVWLILFCIPIAVMLIVEHARQRKLISAKAAFSIAPIWLLLSTVLILLPAASRGVSSVDVLPWCALLLLPFLPLATVPLAMDWGRHR